eukprot:COSAG04_NODE_30362_length_263_cov_0.628049_2_plen_22_part_01
MGVCDDIPEQVITLMQLSQNAW